MGPLKALVSRFGAVWRLEGPGAALRRAGGYVIRRALRRGSATVVPSADAAGQGAHGSLLGIWQSLAQQQAFHITQPPAVLHRRRRIAMIADLNLPQCRKYRVSQLAEFWQGRGVEFDFAHYEDVPRATRIMQQASHLMEYRLQSGPIADMLRYEARRLRLPILYDLDDPLFSVSAYETYRNMEALPPGMKAHFLREAPKFLSMMNGADILSVSTPGMAEHVALYSGRPVFVRRNFADRETLVKGAAALRAEPPDDDLFRVAFASGSKGHEADLQHVLEPVITFLQEDDRRRLLLLGHLDLGLLPDALRSRVETAKFTDYATYLGTLARANCAIMPLCDDAFNRCKSAVRVIDAAAVAVPAIVGPVGDLPQMIRPGETGAQAAHPGGWLEALRQLAADPATAARMGRAARRDLETRWRGSDQPHIIAPELLAWVEG